MKKINFKFKPKKWMIITAIALIIAILAGIVFSNARKNKVKDAFAVTATEETVSRRNITSSITGTAVVQPKDQYSITALVNGDVLAANFEQGDIVNEGDILYQIDAKDAENSIRSANLSLERLQDSYSDALDAKDDLTIRSTVSGVIKTLYIKKGDSINQNAQVAEIYDDSYLLLTLPFNDADADSISAGSSASVHISGTSETLNGTVTKVAQNGYAKEGNMLVRNVEIKVKNPGTLMTTHTATATVNGVSCNASGTFKYLTEKTITAKVSGDVSTLYVSEGSRVSNGTAIAQLTSDAVTDNIKNAARSLEDAQISRENAQERLDDYTITAPISGTVVEKNVKAGDKLDNTNSSTAMAVIYDMSSLEFELSVDELDINSVKIGQKVIITADALDGKMYNGEVANISINGTTSGGVTTYPVTVTITDFDEELLPGMNIDAEIITTSAENVLAVPVTAVNRGNTVYVKGENTDENDRAPEGFKSVKVETGVYNDEFIEIKSGLSEGDIVYVQKIMASASDNPMAQFGAMGGGIHGGMAGGMPQNRNNMGGAPGGMGGGMR